jgi:hypothetical protein
MAQLLLSDNDVEQSSAAKQSAAVLAANAAKQAAAQESAAKKAAAAKEAAEAKRAAAAQKAAEEKQALEEKAAEQRAINAQKVAAAQVAAAERAAAATAAAARAAAEQAAAAQEEALRLEAEAAAARGAERRRLEAEAAAAAEEATRQEQAAAAAAEEAAMREQAIAKRVAAEQAAAQKVAAEQAAAQKIAAEKTANKAATAAAANIPGVLPSDLVAAPATSPATAPTTQNAAIDKTANLLGSGLNTGYIQAPGGEGEIYVPDTNTAQSLNPTNTATPENQDFSKNSAVGAAPWQAGYDTLLRQMGAVQGAADVYKQGSPLSADRHIQNIARTLAKDYGVTNISDIGVRYETRPAWESGSDESRTYNPEEQLPIYYNKTNNQTISAYGRMFGSENEGDGYSEYNFQPVSDGKGGTIVLPVQQYSKSGMGALAQDLGPIMSVVNIALMAEGVPPLAVAAGNVGFQAAAGNINNIGDVLKTAAPVLVGDHGILGGASKVYMAYNAFDKGNVLGGLSSLAGAVGMNGLANDLRFINAVKTGNVAGALTSLGNMSGVFNTPLKDDLGNILKDENGTVQKIGNIKIGGEDNYVTLEEVVKGAGIAANLLSDKPNYGLALQMAGDLAGSKDTIIAGKAASLIEAVASGNPSAINNAVLSLAGQFNSKAPGSVPIENRTANAAVGAVVSDAATDPLTKLTATDLVSKDTSGNQLTPEQIAALNVANTNGLLTTDLGNTLDTVNVSGRNTNFGNVNDDTITAGDIKLTSPISQLTANQIAALTSGNLTSLTSKSTNTLSPVTVTGKSSEAIGANDDTLTNTISSAQNTKLTSAQFAALTSSNLTSLTSKATNTLDSVTVRATSDIIGANDDTLTNITTKDTGALTSKATNTLDSVTVRATSDIIGANDDTLTDITTKATLSLDPVTVRATKDIIGVNDDTLTSQIATITSGATVLTSKQITELTSKQITAITSTQIPAATSGSTVLTSSQIDALTTISPMGLQALGTSDASYWRQTGAKGTGGKGGVRFFDWYDTPENRTMAPPAMTTATFGALTSKQAETIVPPAPKQYFNAATNRYYTDPTGQWTPPAGWAQTTFKDGGDVKTKHFDEGGYADYDLGIDPGYGNDLGGYNFADYDLGMGGGSSDPSYADYDMGVVDPDEYLRGLPSENASYGGGKDLTGQYQKDIKDAAVAGSSTGSSSGASNILKQLADAAKNNPKLTAALAAAGLGGLLGYMGRPKGITPLGMQGLGLSQGQVYGALKGKPVQRAEGGEIGGYAKGGGLHYLKSAEDGMADKIPATIDNKQPAKLSGGEFVIPADVVSHLGNGNSEAGAKQLYAMMDRIRHARTGTKKQGKQINPAKFTPK